MLLNNSICMMVNLLHDVNHQPLFGGVEEQLEVVLLIDRRVAVRVIVYHKLIARVLWTLLSQVKIICTLQINCSGCQLQYSEEHYLGLAARRPSRNSTARRHIQCCRHWCHG